MARKSWKPLPQEFYDRDPVMVAKELLGKQLLRSEEGIRARGRIVEVEAYLAANDPACHASRGQTRRNAVMFCEPGLAYVYMIHARYCLNVVTEPEGVASAVLIRAVEPVEGVEQMQHRRRRQRLRDLARGPARLCEAFGIDRNLNGHDMTRGKLLWIADDPSFDPTEHKLFVSPRIGIRSGHELPLRFCFHGHPFVSRTNK